MTQARCNSLIRALLMALAALILSTVVRAQTEEWKSYSYSSEGFRASFPAQPEKQKKNIETEKGPFELRTYLAGTSAGAFFVGVVDYGDAIANRDPDDVLHGAEGGAMSNSASHLVRDKKITLGIYHGLEFESENQDAHFFCRSYLVGHTLYQVLVVSPASSPDADAPRFLDSFELIPRDQS